MTELNALGLVVGFVLVSFGIKDIVTIRVGRLIIKMSLGGFLIAASLGLFVL